MRSYTKEDWVVGNRCTRTNNALESFNNQIKSHLSVRPSTWQFMMDLHQQVELSFISFNVDRRNGCVRRECKTLDAALRFARTQLNNKTFTVFEFLEYMAQA